MNSSRKTTSEPVQRQLSSGNRVAAETLDKKQSFSNNNDLENQSEAKERHVSRVSFTIGDSSDCDSTTTATTTESRRNSPYFLPASDDDRVPNGTNFDGIVNPWRKFHFQSEEQNGNLKTAKKSDSDRTLENEVDANGKEKEISSSENEAQPLSPNTSVGLMIPNFQNGTLSLARLTDVASEDGENNRPSDWGKWRILVGVAMVQLFSALMVSLQAPFYPAEAEKKGSNATEYGFVFGVFELTVFLISPFYGSRIHKWNPKLVFNIGIFTASLSSIVFGLLDQIPNSTYFIGASAFVRMCEALGESAVITSSFVIVASAFPDSVASTFAIIETFSSVGLISGPIVGSALYQIGGYSLPFLVVGGLLLVAAMLNFVILPSSHEISSYQDKEEPLIISSYKSFRLLGMAGVAVSALCIVLGAMSISYLQATLEPHLRQFGISQLATGAILVISGAVYTLTSPFWGLLCDKIVQLKLVSFCGIAVLICGFSLIGPVPVLKFEQKIWIISLGLTLQGLGLGAILVSSFVSILQIVIKRGLPDTPSTYGLVSSLWTSMFCLGSFFGPTLSGILYDAVGFSNGTLSVIAFSMIMMCILLIFICMDDSELESFVVGTESEHLLNNSTTISTSLYSSDPQPCTSTRVNRISRPAGRSVKTRNSYGSIH